MKVYILKIPVVILRLGMGVLIPHLIIGCHILSPSYTLQGMFFRTNRTGQINIQHLFKTE